jgi:hypothetical protein
MRPDSGALAKRVAVAKDPKVSTETLVEQLTKAGIEASENQVSAGRASMLDAMRVMAEAGLLTKSVDL